MFVYFFPLVCWMSPCLPSQGTLKEVTGGRDLGMYTLTHYWLAEEKKKARTSVTLWINRRKLRISSRFALSLRLQGSGLLKNGRLVQYKGLCKGVLPSKKGIRCVKGQWVNQKRYPLGRGASGMPLLPFRSLAIDSRRIPLGSHVYIPALKRWFQGHGLLHDGCFLADDEGGKIKHRRLDLFVGTQRLFRRFVRSLPGAVRLYLHHPRCRGPIRALSFRKKRRR